MNRRVIAHLDMDAFFASIEIIKNPSLLGKAVIVGGAEKRGVVATCSYEARQFGVHSAMPMGQAKKLCPHATFIEGDFTVYRDYSHRVREILYRMTPHVEAASIDEAYLDLSALTHASAPPITLATLLQQQIYQELNLTCSIGIATSKLVAKIGSVFAKPGGICCIKPGEEKSFLAPLPIDKLQGVGEKTRILLEKAGIKTIGNLQTMPLDLLIQNYGSRGYYFYQAAHGIDSRPVVSEYTAPKSIGAETTFEHDQTERLTILTAIHRLTERAHKDLLRHKMRAGSVSIKLRYYDFKTITRHRILLSDSNNLPILQRELIALFDQHYQGGSPPIRLIGITFRKLTNSYWQPSLFEPPARA